VPRRSRFAVAAEQWFLTDASSETVTTAELWNGLSRTFPDLTTPGEGRKTPKATCMRDLRFDSAFEVANGRITFLKP
jgi:hypothetical protein